MPIKGQQDKKNSPETGTETRPEAISTPEKGVTPEKTASTSSETTRADLDRLRGSIEEERKEKQTRRDFLKDECVKRRNPESWTGNKPEEGFGSSIAKGIIDSGVDEKFGAYIDQFRENGLGDTTNINVIKQAAKDIIYSHYLKTGNDKDTTQNYLKTVLGEKLKYLFSALKEISGDARFGFKKPIDCLQAFSDFTGLNFIKNGYAQLDSLKQALLLEKSDYEFFLHGFKQSLNINLELVDLSGKETTAAAQQPEKMDVGKMLKEGKIALKNPVRITFSSNVDETLAQAKKDIYSQLPENTDPKAREIISAYIMDELKKGHTASGETVEISVNGSFRTVDLSAEQSAKTQAQKAAEEQVKDSAGESAEGFSGSIGKFIASILAILQKFMDSLNGVASKVGLGEEFAGLDATEKTDAVKFKEFGEKSGLNLKTLAPLFMNAEQMKKILKLKKDKGLSWEDYFEKYLTAAETTELKKEQKVDAEKIAEMFTSPNEEPVV